jgi:hypothetical protein
MRRTMIFQIALILVFTICIGFLACQDDDIGTIEGVVQFVDVEGGCWKIAGNDGVSYEPINLPEEFREDGIAVLFKAKHRRDLDSTCMIGQIIELLSIQQVPSEQ